MEHQQIQPQRIGIYLYPQENGKELLVEVDGIPYTVTLDAGKAQALNLPSKTVWGQRYFWDRAADCSMLLPTIHTDPDKSTGKKKDNGKK